MSSQKDTLYSPSNTKPNKVQMVHTQTPALRLEVDIVIPTASRGLRADPADSVARRAAAGLGPQHTAERASTRREPSQPPDPFSLREMGSSIRTVLLGIQIHKVALMFLQMQGGRDANIKGEGDRKRDVPTFLIFKRNHNLSNAC